jgi:hypothetical protein
MFSFFEVPKDVLKNETFMSRFLWQNEGQNKKYRLTKWVFCAPQKTKVDGYFKSKTLE